MDKEIDDAMKSAPQGDGEPIVLFGRQIGRLLLPKERRTRVKKKEIKDIVAYPISLSAFSGMIFNNAKKDVDQTDEDIKALIKLALRVKVLARGLAQ